MKLNLKTLLLIVFIGSLSYLYKGYLQFKQKTNQVQLIDDNSITTITLIDKNSSKSSTPKVSESISAKQNYLGAGSNWHSR